MSWRSVWEARRVGERILCGRQVPPESGLYVCQGEIATIDRFIDRPRVALPAGLTQLPSIVGDDRIDHYTFTARARRQKARGQQPAGHGQVGPMISNRRTPTGAWHTIERSFTRDCPHCGLPNRVTSAVLQSDAP
jgi:hypothetical protein